MILSRKKTFKAVYKHIKKTKNQYRIIDDNHKELIFELSELKNHLWVTDEDDNIDTINDFANFTDGEIEFLCDECNISLIYNIKKSVSQLIDYLTKSTKDNKKSYVEFSVKLPKKYTKEVTYEEGNIKTKYIFSSKYPNLHKIDITNIDSLPECGELVFLYYGNIETDTIQSMYLGCVADEMPIRWHIICRIYNDLLDPEYDYLLDLHPLYWSPIPKLN